MRLRTTYFVAPLLALALLAGCSSDGGDDTAEGKGKGTTTTTKGSSGTTEQDEGTGEGTTTTAAPVTAPGTPSTIKNPKPQPEPDRAKYCGVWGRLVTTNQAPYEDQDPAAVKSHYAAVLGVARELEAAAPLDIKGAVQVAMREAEKVAQSGDRSQFRTDESRVNGRRLQEYAEQYC